MRGEEDKTIVGRKHLGIIFITLILVPKKVEDRI